MAKKTFDTASATEKLFSTHDKSYKHDTQSTHDKHSTQEDGRSPGRPKKAEAEKLRGYRYNLNLDRDLKPFLHEIVWQQRTSITQYINDLIRREMEAYLAEGGTLEEWENE